MRVIKKVRTVYIGGGHTCDDFETAEKYERHEAIERFFNQDHLDLDGRTIRRVTKHIQDNWVTLLHIFVGEIHVEEENDE